jgi:hypothetical protein
MLCGRLDLIAELLFGCHNCAWANPVITIYECIIVFVQCMVALRCSVLFDPIFPSNR